MIDTLVELKKKLLDKHKQTSNRLGSDEYDTGFLAGLESVLVEVDRMMEGEAERQARYYKED